jgi:tetrahydromethanopterin S-methyltransferase subunit E
VVVPRVGLETPWDWGWLGVVAGAGLVGLEAGVVVVLAGWVGVLFELLGLVTLEAVVMPVWVLRGWW